MNQDSAYREHLQKEYDSTITQHRAVWQTFASAFTLALSGILIALVMALDKYPASAPLFAVFPLVIVAWFIMVDLQGKELYLRSKYMVLLEREIRHQTKEPFPCMDTAIQRHIYSTWRYDLLRPLVAAPILIIYLFTVRRGLVYLHNRSLSWLLAGVATYSCAILLTIFLLWLTGRKINRELADLSRDMETFRTPAQPAVPRDG